MTNKKLLNKRYPSNPPIMITTAESFRQRFLGLMGHKYIDPDMGLLFINSHSSRLDAAIHMLFMRFDIAVIWMDESLLIVDKIIARKWHLNYSPQRPAKYILETHINRFNDFEIGDQIEIQ